MPYTLPLPTTLIRNRGNTMRKVSPVRLYGAATALLGILGAQVVAIADAPTGVTWQESTTMEMPGMTMPAHAMQVCIAPGKEDEALSKPQSPGIGGNCSVQDMQHDGNKFTAKLICTGKTPMQGTVERVGDGDHFVTTIVMSMEGQQLTLKTEAQKVGTPCTPKAIPGAH
jgi:hypothetical protein